MRVADDGDVAAFAFHLGFAERNQQLHVLVFDHALVAVEKLALEHEDRVVVADRGLEQSLGVARRRRRADFQTGDIRVKTFGGVRMGRAELVRRAVRAAEGDRDVELAARHGEHVRRVVHDLVEGDERKAEGHELDDRPQPDHRRADAEAGEAIFADRRVDDALRAETLEQSLADFVGAVVFGDFFAHQEDIRVALDFFGERFVQRLAVGDFSHAFYRCRAASAAGAAGRGAAGVFGGRRFDWSPS